MVGRNQSINKLQNLDQALSFLDRVICFFDRDIAWFFD